MGVVAPGASTDWQVYAGTPCWIELTTTEPRRAQEFYGGLFGWTFEVHKDPQAGEHLIAMREGYPVASIRNGMAAKSRWRVYLATEDCAGTTDQAVRLGARVSVPHSKIPGVGTKATLVGPDDADFGLLEPEDSWQFDVGLPGTLNWAELLTIKAQTSDQFFHSLFGYDSEQFGTEHRYDYAVWYLGGDSVLARVSMIREHIAPGAHPHWLLYLGADPEKGTDDLVHEAIALGGRVRIDPYDSTLGRVAVLRDPTGARFAVVDPTQAPGDYGSAANYDPYED